MSENLEAFTPKEEAEVKAEMAVRDAWLAVTAATKMYNDPLSRPFIERQFDEIKSTRTKLEFLTLAIMMGGK